MTSSGDELVGERFIVCHPHDTTSYLEPCTREPGKKENIIEDPEGCELVQVKPKPVTVPISPLAGKSTNIRRVLAPHSTPIPCENAKRRKKKKSKARTQRLRVAKGFAKNLIRQHFKKN